MDQKGQHDLQAEAPGNGLVADRAAVVRHQERHAENKEYAQNSDEAVQFQRSP